MIIGTSLQVDIRPYSRDTHNNVRYIVIVTTLRTCYLLTE